MTDSARTIPPSRLTPHPDRLGPEHPDYAEIMRRHSAALASGQTCYPDPRTGLVVMTAATLWARPCCENGCRHCPHVRRPDEG